MEASYDQNLYSRQEMTYGAETMRRLVRLRVVVVGLGGVGVEVAKNLVLLGPARVVLCDPRRVRAADAGHSFYFRAAAEGATREEALVRPLAELNPNVRVEPARLLTLAELPRAALLADADLLVVCDLLPWAFMAELGAALRARGCKLVVTLGLGLAGCVFNDFGPAHLVTDKDGEECATALVSAVQPDGTITTQEDKRHRLSVGDLVRFSELVGAEALNGQVLRVVEVPSPFSFRVQPLPVERYGRYERNGVVEEVKATLTLPFLPLERAFDAEALPDCDLDFESVERVRALRLLLQALWQSAEWDAEGFARPALHDEQLLARVLAQSRAACAAEPDAETRAQLERCLASQLPGFFVGLAAAELAPVSAFFGGIAAQEVVKATGKYTPVAQWFLHEFYSTVFAGAEYRRPEPGAAAHRDQLAVLGRAAQTRLESLRLLQVGAGALGCELLKMFALMGVCCGEGLLTVVDDDVIEVSNLNRQFLFRREHVGESKSKVACAAARAINPALKVTDLFGRLEAVTERLFPDAFWDELDFVVNAVDNVAARRYVDQKAVFHRKPLLESGTLGTKCNTQMIVPGATECYSDSVDPPERAVPMCTLRSFPFLPEHVIEWAREKFNELFAAPAKFLAEFYGAEDPARKLAETLADLRANPAKYRELSESLGLYLPLLGDPRPAAYARVARDFFAQHFDAAIAQLITLFPADYVDKEGRLFWSSPKRPPRPVEFEAGRHAAFVLAAVKVLRQAVRPVQDFEPSEALVREAVAALPRSAAAPAAADREQLTNENSQAATDVEGLSELLRALHELAPRVRTTLRFHEVEFEKDHDENGHVDFMFLAANLRAENYSIPAVDRQRVKFIAGRIIPAIATTTAMVIGAVGIEVYKHVLGVQPAQFRNFFSNLALPMFYFAQPSPPRVYRDKDYDEVLLGPVKAIPTGFDTWSRLEATGPLTVAELAAQIRAQHGFNISSMMCGACKVWNTYEPRMKERLGWRIEDILSAENVQRYKGMRYLALLIAGETDEMVDVLSPYVKYTLGPE